jgi:hypothetical protein
MLVRVVRSGAVRAPWRARCGQLTRARQEPPYRGRRRSGFALPPPALTDLRILHGSCRRPGFIYPDDTEGTKSFDGPAWVDDLILEWRRGTPTSFPLDPNVRPHQLFFTGDQIYADDVATPLLPMLNKVSATGCWTRPRAPAKARAGCGSTASKRRNCCIRGNSGDNPG